ncbi:hypothetical protein TREAZ_0841 [Leadbettera azotonutricia ZAS-9]|uniref:Uncharacterized protein n=1 Tax=Leadbettera azotonutricia (strain ATCC BAA-888 / DSM 13862 / ZAS-9) TaxID=545695 RepID=F5Y9J8_LEAAZ|nr:hypothetical protein TREAZ_0841 [Leadbettera azotonutricia ZAS-9]
MDNHPVLPGYQIQFSPLDIFSIFRYIYIKISNFRDCVFPVKIFLKNR